MSDLLTQDFELGRASKRTWWLHYAPSSGLADLQDATDGDFATETWDVACEGRSVRFPSIDAVERVVTKIMEAHQQRDPEDGRLHPDVLAILDFHVKRPGPPETGR